MGEPTDKMRFEAEVIDGLMLAPNACSICRKWFLPYLAAIPTEEAASYCGGHVHDECGASLASITAERDALRERMEDALEVAFHYGGIDGDHHKAWVVDQIVRELTGEGYEAWVSDFCGPDDEYVWHEGVAP